MCRLYHFTLFRHLYLLIKKSPAPSRPFSENVNWNRMSQKIYDKINFIVWLVYNPLFTSFCSQIVFKQFYSIWMLYRFWKRTCAYAFQQGHCQIFKEKRLRTILHSVTCTKVGHTLCFMSEQQDSHVLC